MSPRKISWIVGMVLLGMLCLNDHAQAHAATEVYQAGAARRDVTPDYPIRLNGFGSRRAESEGVGQRIWAKALAISQGDEAPVVLLAVDNLGVRYGMVEQVAEALWQSHQVPRGNVVLTFTHSHCTPKVDGASDTIFSSPIAPAHQQHITQYTAELTDALIAVAREALDTRQAARLSWATGTVRFAMNRRTPGGPVDHSLPVLFVHSEQDALLAVYTTYACHCVTLSYNKIHGDWAGCAAEAIQHDHPGAIAMVSIGCGSDANPTSGVTGANEAMAAEQGGEIAAEVKRILAGPRAPVRGAPRAVLSQIELPLQSPPTRAQLSELAQQPSAAGYNAAWQLQKLERDGQLPDHLDYPIQTIRFGEDLAMVFLAGEVCVDYAIRLREEVNADKLWLHAYSNDFCAYIPSERLLREGGYGGGAEVVYFALPAMLAPGLEDKIVHEVVGQLPPAWRIEPGTQGVPPSDPEQSLRKFQLLPQYEIQLVASEPQVQDPVAIDFGLDRRLWVVEMADYARAVDAEFEGRGRVKWLTDEDGDGRFETAQVFLEGLRFPTDVKVWRDGVLVCDAPDVLFARDTDQDGRADQVERLLTGFATHNPHARVNSLRWGLDGWVYGSCGLFGGDITTADGRRVDLNGRDFRWRPDSGELEPVSGRTQQGRARSDWNEWFGCDNGTLLRYYPLEERYLRRNPQVASPPTQVAPLFGPNAARLFPAGSLVLFKLSGPPGQPTSACGLEIYRDDYLGEDFAGNSLTCEPVHQLVHRRVLRRTGGELQAVRAPEEETSEFLTSTDRWFRPVQVRTGPDGALWIVDMYRYVIEHPRWIPGESLEELDVFAGQDRGRIYRILRRDQAPVSWSDMTDAADAQLLNWAAARNGTVRDLAHQRLVWDNRIDLAPALHRMAREEARPEARVEALAILTNLGQLDAPLLLHRMADLQPHVRCWAIRCSESLLADEQVRQAVISRMQDDDPLVRRQALWSLGAADHPQAVAAMIEAWPRLMTEPVERCAILSSLRPASLAAWQERILQNSPPGRAEAWTVPELMRVAFAGLADREWQSLLQGMTKSTAINQELLGDPRLRALVAARPSQRTPFDKALQKDVAQLRELALNAIKKNGDLPRHEVENHLAFWLSLSSDRDDAASTLLSLVSTQHPLEVQRVVVESLAARFPNDWNTLLARLREVTPNVQSAAMDAWLERQAGRQWLGDQCRANAGLLRWLSSEQRSRWLERTEPAGRAALQELLDLPPTPGRSEVVKTYAAALAPGGDVAHGQQLFLKHCAACHRFGSDGATLGPDLNALGNKTKQSLLTAILDPSQDIDSRYRNLVIETVDGQTLTGLLLEETGTTLRLQTTPEQTRTILREDIETLRANPVSFMPVGLEKELPVVGMCDLLEFLVTPQQPPKQLPGNTPIVVRAAPAGDLLLHASAAEIYGAGITFEMPFANIGYWHAPTDHVVWQCETNEAGVYNVELEYACADASAGNVLRLSVAAAQLTGEVAGTGGWDQYQTWNLGQITLPAGPLRLKIEPTTAPRNALLDLKSVRLKRVPSDDSR